MPTRPSHQGWAAIHAISSTASSCSSFRYSSARMPPEAASYIDPEGGEAVAGEEGMDALVDGETPVAAAVGNVFQDRRHRVLFRVRRPPQARGQAGAVRQGDPERRLVDNLVGEILKGLEVRRCAFWKHARRSCREGAGWTLSRLPLSAVQAKLTVSREHFSDTALESCLGSKSGRTNALNVRDRPSTTDVRAVDREGQKMTPCKRRRMPNL
jgi:hypothetical protein